MDPCRPYTPYTLNSLILISRVYLSTETGVNAKDKFERGGKIEAIVIKTKKKCFIATEDSSCPKFGAFM